ncbi:MAG: hypothetical protein ACR2QE_01240 [Acidimicrobiales bacterium]
MVLIMVLFAVQLIYDLYATSVVSGAAYDAAREVAGYDSHQRRAQAAGVATEELRRRLGSYGHTIEVQWRLDDPGVVELRVFAVHPSILPARWSGRTPLGTLERTIRIRRETR